MHYVWQVFKTPTIILNNPVYSKYWVYKAILFILSASTIFLHNSPQTALTVVEYINRIITNYSVLQVSVRESHIQQDIVCRFPWRGFWWDEMRKRIYFMVINFKYLSNIPSFCWRYITIWGTAVAQWLRSCATNRKVASSIPDGVLGILHWHNPSDRTIALGSTQPLIEMSTKNISWW